MADHAYGSVWLRDSASANLLAHFERLLEAVPFSAAAPGLTSLLVRAVDHAEAPLAEHDLRGAPLTAAEWVALAREHEGADCAYEAQAWWDLWALDAGQWQRRPHRLELVCCAEQFDGGTWADEGHVRIDLGFEHLFTGYPGALFASQSDGVETAGRTAEELQFHRWLRVPENLASYRERTRENGRALLEWMERVRARLPVERYRLWSEGEEDFEARLDDVLAVR